MAKVELTPTQIKALEAGATMFIFPISDYDLNRINKGYSIGDSIPINKGDKDIFVKEEFMIHDTNDGYFNTYYKASKPTFTNNSCWEQSSRMTKEQSRYSFNECIDIRVVRVQNISIKSKIEIMGHVNINMELNKDAYNKNFIYHYNQQMQEQNINRTYEDNDYVFLVEFKR